MNTTCPQNVWNHTTGCSCTGTTSHAKGPQSRSVFGSYGTLDSDFINPATIDLDDPNSVTQINRAYQQEDFLRLTTLTAWTPQETTEEERALVDSLSGSERRQAEIALHARAQILTARGSDRRPVTQDEADKAWFGSSTERARLDEEQRSRPTPVYEDDGYDTDLMGTSA